MRWAPMPGPQLDAIEARCIDEMLFGGARGGGKTQFLLGDWCASADIGLPWRGVLFRQSYPELEEIITQSQQLIPACWPGSEWFKQEKTWRLANGASLRLRNLETADDAIHYQGHQYSWVGWDELGAWPNDQAYRMLIACLRSGDEVPHKRIRSSANPGGPGHGWVKERFIDPAPHGYETIFDPLTKMYRIFIPSRVTDNQILLARDPGYVDRLRGVGSPELVRAWLTGDWNAVVGSYFPEFGPAHIIKPMRIPSAWLRFRAMDWGSARPFAVGWFAVSDGSHRIPAGAIVMYRELYGKSAPNVGVRWTAEQVADRIREAELADEPVAYGVADPAMFAEDGGPSLAERFSNRKVYFQPADNKRVGRMGALAGWDLVRQRLIGDDGVPMFYVFNTCRDLIRTLPSLQHDADRPEDMDSSGEDHCADMLRYACASRPWIKAPAPEEKRLDMEMLFRQRERMRRLG